MEEEGLKEGLAEFTTWEFWRLVNSQGGLKGGFSQILRGYFRVPGQGFPFGPGLSHPELVGLGFRDLENP